MLAAQEDRGVVLRAAIVRTVRSGAFCLLLLCSIGECTSGELPEEADEVLKESLAMYAATDAVLKTARASGTWVMTLADGRTFVHANWKLQFAGDQKYNLSIDLIERASGPSQDDVRRHLVCDGNAIAVTTFAPRYHPSGCESEIRRLDLSEYIVATGGLDFRLHHLGGSLRPKATRETNTLVSRTLLESGNVAYRYRVDVGSAAGYERVIEVSPDAGFHVTRSTLYRRSGERALEHKLSWHEFQSVWWPLTFETRRWRIESPDNPEIQRVECHTFEPNVELDPGLFTLDAVDRCDRTRLIDRRNSKDIRIYEFPAIPEAPNDPPDKFDTSISKLRESYRNEPSPPITATPDRRIYLRWLATVNALAAGVGILLFALRRFRRGKTPQVQRRPDETIQVTDGA